MERLVIAAVIVAVVGVVALVARRRSTPDAPTQRTYNVPQQLDRADFPRPEAPWLVTVFSSSTCEVCAGVVDRAEVLQSDEVALAVVDYGADRALHDKYAIDAVPTLVVSDAAGVTKASFLGPVNATDMWAAVAEARDPGAAPGHRPPPETSNGLWILRPMGARSTRLRRGWAGEVSGQVCAARASPSGNMPV